MYFIVVPPSSVVITDTTNGGVAKSTCEEKKLRSAHFENIGANGRAANTARVIRPATSGTLPLAGMLIRDERPLVHRAVGWMLRGVGKRLPPRPVVAGQPIARRSPPAQRE